MHDLIPVCDDHSYQAINRLLLEKALRCPECGAHQTALFVMSNTRIVKPSYLIICGECKYQGTFAKNIPDAVKAWNKPMGFLPPSSGNGKENTPESSKRPASLKSKGPNNGDTPSPQRARNLCRMAHG